MGLGAEEPVGACFRTMLIVFFDRQVADEDAHKVAVSERATEDLLSRLAECERRKKQSEDFLALLQARAADPGAAELAREESDRFVHPRIFAAVCVSPAGGRS